jgi:hypothetical protein
VLAWLTCGTPPLIYTCYIPNGIFGNSTHPHFDIFIIVPLNLVFSHILTQHRLRLFSAIGSNHLQGVQHVLFTFVHQSLSIHQGDIGRSPLKALQGGQGNAKTGHPEAGRRRARMTTLPQRSITRAQPHTLNPAGCRTRRVWDGDACLSLLCDKLSEKTMMTVTLTVAHPPQAPSRTGLTLPALPQPV